MANAKATNDKRARGPGKVFVFYPANGEDRTPVKAIRNPKDAMDYLTANRELTYAQLDIG